MLASAVEICHCCGGDVGRCHCCGGDVGHCHCCGGDAGRCNCCGGDVGRCHCSCGDVGHCHCCGGDVGHCHCSGGDVGQILYTILRQQLAKPECGCCVFVFKIAMLRTGHWLEACPSILESKGEQSFTASVHITERKLLFVFRIFMYKQLH